MQPGARQQHAPTRIAARDDTSGVRIAIRPADPRPAIARDPFLEATLAAERAALPGADLSAVWQAVMDRRLTVCAEGAGAGSRYLVARASIDASRPGRALSRIETAVLVRVLSGEQQKLVAAELGIACSTASKWYTQGLARLHLDGRPIPAPLVIAAQAWASGQNPPVEARGASFVHDGSQYFVLSIPKPAVSTQGTLTPAECEVARFLIEGESRWEIAARRETSAQTVACQIRGIFSKWRLTGRYALIRRAAEQGWFR
jgi:DNA-binding NarL/FixJ family response regulator